MTDEKARNGIDLRYCSASWGSARCDLRYDHGGLHRDSLLGTRWPRIYPPDESDSAGWCGCSIDGTHRRDCLRFTSPEGAPVTDEKAQTCCTEHDGCDRPGEMVCCDRCPDIEKCACGHGWHLHDGDADPSICMPCGCAEQCSTPPDEGFAACDECGSRAARCPHDGDREEGPW